MAEHSRARLAGMAALAVIVVVIVLAFALGGTKSPSGTAGTAGAPSAVAPAARGAGAGTGANAPTTGFGVAHAGRAPVAAPTAATSAAGSVAVRGQVSSTAGSPQLESAADSVTATRVVKTGSLSLRVARGQVQSTVAKLVALTTSMGGYVSQSHTDDIQGSPDGEVTLRIPAGQFDNAVTAAEKLGHVTSLTTNAHDVTGRYVDLGARLAALRQTRTTYLTILGRARTIGSTLEVQQRVDDVQQQIEELQGQLKVLGNQSADGTLTADVTQVGSKTLTPHRHHKHNGIGAAWHRSINRFARGFDAIVGALGPLLLAILVLAVIAGVAGLGYRGVRRATGQTTS
jgi:hypothetical protein